ncbi:MAG: thiamine pyrophosphate-requiring protein, partial [Xanthobacteraceae bacterium]
MTDTKTQNGMAAEAYIARLGERGIEYVFANAGTDFAPIVEALSHTTSAKIPRFMTVPHENVAMAMAHGYYRIAGKPAAVMVHVTVGTANAINGIINAARDNIPVLLAAGRTPLTETGSIASRNRPIHWGQEAFDQGGMLREYVKWDYELRGGQPVAAVVDRALDIAMSEPRGPVYLTLPREVLTAPAIDARRDTVRPLGAMAPEPARAAIEEAAALIAKAEFPLIVTSSSGRVAEAVGALAALAADFALPVVQAEARDMNLPTDHPMHLGHDPGAFLPKADVVIVIDSAVPWMARNHTPRKDAKIINISADPLETRYPFRELEADLLVSGNSLAAMTMLRATLGEAMKGKKTAIETRRKALAAMREEIDARRRNLIETVKDQTPIHPAWLAACINQVKSEDAIVISELGAPLAMLNLTKPLSYMGGLLSGGLGFGLGAGLGAKLAAPKRDVI